MTEAVSKPVDKNIIDGSLVVVRTMGRLITPASKNADGLSPTYGVDRCELADGRVKYQCVWPDAPNCEYFHDKGESVRSHLRKHTLVSAKARQQVLKDELEELRKREAQRKENYKNGAIRGVAKRKITMANRAAANGTTNHDYIGSIGSKGTDMATEKTTTVEQLLKEISDLQVVIEGVADGLDKTYTIHGNIVKTLDKLVEKIGELAAAELDETDLATKDKAARWDQLQGLMGNANN